MFGKTVSYIVSFIKKAPIISALAGLTLVCITLSMIIFFETVSDVVTAIPLFISIIIMMLQSQANRYSFLLGSLNSVFYTIVYFAFELQASALSALCVSLPIQMMTFISWSKHKYKDSTMFRKMSMGARVISLAVGIVAVFIVNLILRQFGSNYIMLDTITNVAGVGVYVLTLLSFVEYPILQMFSSIIGCINYIIMISDGKYTLIPYLIYTVFGVACIAKAAVRVHKLYVEQQNPDNHFLAKEN